MPLLEELKQRARRLKAEVFALYLAARHPDTPWYAKLLVAAVVAYAFSPIDLIPDFIPVLGHLDDLVLIPMGIALAVKLVPATVLAECRARAQEDMANAKPASRVAAAVVVIIWLVVAGLCAVWAYEKFTPASVAPNPAASASRASMHATICSRQRSINAGMSSSVSPAVGIGGSARMISLPLCQRFSRMLLM